MVLCTQNKSWKSNSIIELASSRTDVLHCFCDAEFQIASSFKNCIVKNTIQRIALLFHWPTKTQILSSDRQNHNHISIEEMSSPTSWSLEWPLSLWWNVELYRFFGACFGALDYDNTFGQKRSLVRHCYRLCRIICATDRLCLTILNSFESGIGTLYKGNKNMHPGHCPPS